MIRNIPINGLIEYEGKLVSCQKYNNHISNPCGKCIFYAQKLLGNCAEKHECYAFLNYDDIGRIYICINEIIE